MSSVIDYLSGRLPKKRKGFRHNPSQTAYAESIGEAISMGRGRWHFVEGDTGIGKTVAYLLQLADWVAAGAEGDGKRQRRKTARRRQVVISTHSRALQQQLMQPGNQELMRDYLDWRGLRPVTMKVRMGRPNYVSLSRLAHALHADDLSKVIDSKDRPRSERDLAAWALKSDGCLLDLDDEALPVGITREDICLSSHEPLPADIERLFEQAREADIVVINHALLAREMLQRGSVTLGDEAEQIVLVDEAEHAPEAAAAMTANKLSFRAVTGLAEILGYKAAAKAWTELTDVFTSPGMADEARRLRQGPETLAIVDALQKVNRTRVSESDPDADEAEWLRVREAARSLLRTLDQYRDEAVLSFSRVLGLPSLVQERPGAGAILRNHEEDRITIMTSATLSDLVGDAWNPSFRFILSELRIARTDASIGVTRCHHAANFGSMTFLLPAEELPKPMQEKGRGYEIRERYIQRAIRETIEGVTGRVLLLCASYEDVEALEAQWPVAGGVRLVAHRRGLDISRLAAGLASGECLATPAGWEGLSPDRDGTTFWQRIVILRNPTPRIETTHMQLAAQSFESQGQDSLEARNSARRVLRARAFTQSLHKVRQGLGRGIRHPDDHVEVLFLDPRFGMGSQAASPAIRSRYLDAIPQRFRHLAERAIEGDELVL